MKIYIDNDACPKMAKEILIKTSKREEIELIFVANSMGRYSDKPLIKYLVVGEGADVADDKIVELISEGDIAITSDIPLADRVVKKGALVVTPKGELLDEESIGDRLGVRDLMDDLRNSGVICGGPAPYSVKDKGNFANLINKILSKRRR